MRFFSVFLLPSSLLQINSRMCRGTLCYHVLLRIAYYRALCAFVRLLFNFAKSRQFISVNLMVLRCLRIEEYAFTVIGIIGDFSSFGPPLRCCCCCGALCRFFVFVLYLVTCIRILWRNYAMILFSCDAFGGRCEC